MKRLLAPSSSWSSLIDSIVKRLGDFPVKETAEWWHQFPSFFCRADVLTARVVEQDDERVRLEGN